MNVYRNCHCTTLAFWAHLKPSNLVFRSWKPSSSTNKAYSLSVSDHQIVSVPMLIFSQARSLKSTFKKWKINDIYACTCLHSAHVVDTFWPSGGHLQEVTLFIPLMCGICYCFRNIHYIFNPWNASMTTNRCRFTARMPSGRG